MEEERDGFLERRCIPLEVRGRFSSYDLSTIEKDTFAEYLQHSMNNPAMEFIKYLLGDDYIKFIDIMSGMTVKIPSSKSLERDLESVKIFLYVKRGNFSEDSIREASRIYNKTILTARRYILKVAKVLGIEDTLDGDDLNNYIQNIKSIEDLDSYYQTKTEANRVKIVQERKKREEERLAQLSNVSKDEDDLDPEEVVITSETKLEALPDEEGDEIYDRES